MSTINPLQSLYIKYFNEFGVIPDRAEYFMVYCKKQGVTIRYKDCIQLLTNPPTQLNGEHTPNAGQTPRSSVIVKEHSEEDDENAQLKYATEHSHNTHSSESHKQSSSKSESPPLLYSTHNLNHHSATNKFHKLNGATLPNTIRVSMDLSSYISPEILIDEMIPIKDSSMNIRSFHRNINEFRVHKCHLIRDFILFILYWCCLINAVFGFYDFYHFHDFYHFFNIWYFRFICLFISQCCLIIGVLCHMYFKSPPFYSDKSANCKYIQYFDQSTVEYIKEWNEREYIETETEINNENMDSVLSMRLFHIEMYGSFSDSQCGFVDIKAHKIENKSMDILNDIIKKKNALIRLRVYHIMRFKNDRSYRKFVHILKEQKVNHREVDQMFHIEYNVKFERRLLMNTTHNSDSFCSIWNKCCTNRKLSYIWYIFGFGFFYRCYHDCCVKTHVYDCVKEVTL